MDDLVKRLREGAELAETMPKPTWFLKAICPEAADRIEELEVNCNIFMAEKQDLYIKIAQLEDRFDRQLFK